MNSILKNVRLISVTVAATLAGLAGNVSAAEDQGTMLPRVTIVSSQMSDQVRTAINDAVGRRSPEIIVNNNGGHISLTGWAYSSAAVRIAMAVAREVDGVKSVTDNGVHLWSSRSSSDYF
jgi:BON domain